MKLALALVLVAAEARADGGWEVRVPPRIEVALGATAAVPIAIALDRGLTVSRDAPVRIDLVPPPVGLTVKKRRLARTDAVDPEADAPRFAPVVRGDLAGEHALELRIQLWICARATCRPVSVRAATTIAVE